MSAVPAARVVPGASGPRATEDRGAVKDEASSLRALLAADAHLRRALLTLDDVPFDVVFHRLRLAGSRCSRAALRRFLEEEGLLIVAPWRSTRGGAGDGAEG